MKICFHNNILPLSLKESIPIIRVSQTILTLTNFIRKYNNIYDLKGAPCKNMFLDKSNDTSLIP